MTSEAVVLNKSAVAMAADSAVTISDGRSAGKTYDTANKLFELIKGRPVGIMVYANAAMNGVPWETIIKTYREENSTFTSSSLEGYVSNFADFLNIHDSFLFSEESEKIAFENIAREHYLKIAVFLRDGLEKCVTRDGKLVEAKLNRLLNTAIQNEETELKQRELGPWTSLSEAEIRKAYGDLLLPLMNRLFKPLLKLSPSQIKRLEKIAIAACQKTFPYGTASGVVISGFGEKDAFPSLFEVQIRDRILGVTRAVRYEPMVIGHKNPGNYRTFAQNEVPLQFVTGINGKTRHVIVDYWSNWIQEGSKTLRNEVASQHSRLSESTLDSIADTFIRLGIEGQTAFVNHMNVHQRTTFEDPLVSSIQFLPKDELVHMAETLVNLTSVVQRFSVYRDETVGGEIDVALISRGDGLVWLKRKHYFSLTLNPTWPETHKGK